jgi:hypothetical protein
MVISLPAVICTPLLATVFEVLISTVVGRFTVVIAPPVTLNGRLFPKKEILPVVFSSPVIKSVTVGVPRFPGNVSQKSVPLLSFPWAEAELKQHNKMAIKKYRHGRSRFLFIKKA